MNTNFVLSFELLTLLILQKLWMKSFQLVLDMDGIWIENIAALLCQHRAHVGAQGGWYSFTRVGSGGLVHSSERPTPSLWRAGGFSKSKCSLHSCVGGCWAINRAGSGDYWKPPISCHEQSPPVQQGCILLYNQLTDRPFISTEVEAINLAKVYSRLRMEVKRKTK